MPPTGSMPLPRTRPDCSMRASALPELYSTASHISAALQRSDVTAGSRRFLGVEASGVELSDDVTALVSALSCRAALSCSGSRSGGDSALGAVATLRRVRVRVRVRVGVGIRVKVKVEW